MAQKKLIKKLKNILYLFILFLPVSKGHAVYDFVVPEETRFQIPFTYTQGDITPYRDVVISSEALLYYAQGAKSGSVEIGIPHAFPTDRVINTYFPKTNPVIIETLTNSAVTHSARKNLKEVLTKESSPLLDRPSINPIFWEDQEIGLQKLTVTGAEVTSFINDLTEAFQPRNIAFARLETALRANLPLAPLFNKLLQDHPLEEKDKENLEEFKNLLRFVFPKDNPLTGSLNHKNLEKLFQGMEKKNSFEDLRKFINSHLPFALLDKLREVSELSPVFSIPSEGAAAEDQEEEDTSSSASGWSSSSSISPRKGTGSSEDDTSSSASGSSRSSGSSLIRTIFPKRRGGYEKLK